MKLFRSSYEIAACTQAAIVMSFPRRTAREGKKARAALRCNETGTNGPPHPSLRATFSSRGRLRGVGRRGAPGAPSAASASRHRPFRRGKPCHLPRWGRLCFGNVFATILRQQGLSGGRERAQNPRSRAEGVHSYVESKRTGREKRISIKRRKPFVARESPNRRRFSSLISV